MEKSRLFDSVAEPCAAGVFYALVSGERCEQFGAPARVAWEIEHLAMLRDWPAGELLGSEASLREHLHVSRETLREAIRIVESRGAMQMRRGRAGGLMLTNSSIPRTATALATYLRATGITPAQIAQSVHGLDQLLAWQLARQQGPLASARAGEPVRHWLARASGQPVYQLYAATFDTLSPAAAVQPVPAALRAAITRRDAGEIAQALAGLPFVSARGEADPCRLATTARAAAIAVGIATHSGASGGSDLGNEASLCEQFDTSRSVIRQALRILQDLDIIQVRLGRGGGYARKRPSPIGVIRQLFPWLAAEHSCPFALMDLMWELNAANLRLAGEQFAAMPADARDAWLARLDLLFVEAGGTRRFIRLQQALAEIAGCPLIDTLARCIVSYQARRNGDVPHDGPPDAFVEEQRAIVAWLRAGDLDRAEATLRAAQHEIHEATLHSFGIRFAAE